MAVHLSKKMDVVWHEAQSNDTNATLQCSSAENGEEKQAVLVRIEKDAALERTLIDVDNGSTLILVTAHGSEVFCLSWSKIRNMFGIRKHGR